MRITARSLWRASRGFSVAEVTMILTALSILSAAAAPTLNGYVEDTKLVRAAHDVGTLAVSLVRMFNDVAAERNTAQGWASYDVLVGGGATPAALGAGTDAWASPADAKAVGVLDDHLITNAASYTQRPRGATFGWRGAYLDQPVQPDPWGNRYAVNVRAMRSSNFDTLVLSAGPDGLVESAFELDGLLTQGDDIVSLVAPSGISQ